MVVASDADCTLVRGLTVNGDDLQTSHLTLEGTGNRSVGSVLQLLTIDRLDGANKLSLLKSTIAHDDGSFKDFGVVCKIKVNYGASSDSLFDCLVSDALAN